MPIRYYKYICEEKNFLYLNGKNVLQPKVLQIIADFVEKDEQNYKLVSSRIILLDTRTFFNMCIVTFTQKFTARLKKEALT